MYNVVARKKESNIIVVKVDLMNVARGHITFPKAGRHKDKRRKAKVNQRASFKHASFKQEY